MHFYCECDFTADSLRLLFEINEFQQRNQSLFFLYDHSVFHIQPVISYITQSDSDSPQTETERERWGTSLFHSAVGSVCRRRERYKYFSSQEKTHSVIHTTNSNGKRSTCPLTALHSGHCILGEIGLCLLP